MSDKTPPTVEFTEEQLTRLLNGHSEAMRGEMVKLAKMVAVKESERHFRKTFILGALFGSTLTTLITLLLKLAYDYFA